MQRGNSNAPPILVASICSIEQLEHLAACGHDTFTQTPKIADQFGLDVMNHKAVEGFEKARLS